MKQKFTLAEVANLVRIAKSVQVRVWCLDDSEYPASYTRRLKVSKKEFLNMLAYETNPHTRILCCYRPEIDALVVG